MIIPPYLSKGATIGIVSPAGAIPQEDVLPSVSYLKSLGYNVVVGKQTFTRSNTFAGTDEQRSRDFQQMIDDPKIDAIICSRGGYGTIRTLLPVDWTKFINNPKWIVGFSDITVIHSFLHQMDICSIHGTMPRSFLRDGKPTESFESMHRCLIGQSNRYVFDSDPLNRVGSVSAPIVGGNLSLLYSLRGTRYDLDFRGKILFIEDVSEYYYNVDRMMMNLKAGGVLDHLAGLVVGQFSEMKDNDTPFGKDVREIVSELTKEYNYPVCFNFPAGHVDRNLALKLGTTVRLEISATGSKLINE